MGSPISPKVLRRSLGRVNLACRGLSQSGRRVESSTEPTLGHRDRADEVGASLKWATAKVERTSQCGNGDRAQGRERQAERGSDLNDQPLLSTHAQHAREDHPGACCISTQ
jgi:hypothetical protein